MKVLITTSTLPISDDDKVPAFVKDQAIELKKQYPKMDIVIHAPHNSYSETKKKMSDSRHYREARFHYFWPRNWELLSGRGILPALRQNKLLYLQIPFLFFFQFVSLLRLARKEKPDLLYAHWFTPQAINSALVSKFTGIPFMFTTHASDVSVWRKVPFSKKLVAWVCSRAGAYTAVSERTKGKLVAFFDDKTWGRDFSSKLSIIPMGVASDVPKISSSDIAAAQKSFGIPRDKKYLLSLGRLAEKKGITYLLQAFSSLPTSSKADIHLVIAGDGQLRPVLEKEAKQLGIKSVTFTGYVHGKEKDAIFAMADYVCLPSIIDDSGDSEGFPVVVMESLAAGKVVIASDATGAEDILIDGETGYIFPQKTVKPLADKLISAIELDPTRRNKMEKAAKELATQFDWAKIAREHYEIFQRVLS